MNSKENIIKIILERLPETQAIYLFGSYGTDDEWPNSDADIAVLLPDEQAKEAGSLNLIKLCSKLERLLKKGVDLINLRLVSTVFQKEIVVADRRIFCADRYAADEFEMLTFSYYQKLNEERKQILEEFFKTGKAYAV